MRKAEFVAVVKLVKLCFNMLKACKEKYYLFNILVGLCVRACGRAGARACACVCGGACVRAGA